MLFKLDLYIAQLFEKLLTIQKINMPVYFKFDYVNFQVLQ